MRIIDLETHFLTQDYVDYLRRRKIVPREEYDGSSIKLWYSEELDLWQGRNPKVDERLADLGEGRLKTMDNAGIAMQVVSLTNPNVQLFEPDEGTRWAKRTNDYLSAAVKKHPDRFIGLATVAPQSPQAAADELERAVTELGLKGLLIQSHARNEYLDDVEYQVIFEKAAKLDVPVYIHPIIPSTQILKPFAKYGMSLAGPVLGFAADVSLHVMRLILSGLFDRLPKLQIILGHLGEGLPFWLYRMDFDWLKVRFNKRPAIEKKPSDYIRTNFTVTTSGMFSQPPFLCSYLAMGPDKICFASDYPSEDPAEALQFMKEAPICDADKEKICHLNAKKLFKL